MYEHARPQAHLRIRHLDARRHRPVLGIDSRLKKIDNALDGTAPKRGRGDPHFQSGTYQRDIGFKDVGVHPHCIEIGYFQQNIAFFDILPFGDVALGNHTRNRRIRCDLNRFFGSRRDFLNLFRADAPQFQTPAAGSHQFVRVTDRLRFLTRAEALAIFQGEPVLLSCRENFGTVNQGNRLPAIDSLPCDVDKQLLNAAADPGADGTDTGFRFHHFPGSHDLFSDCLPSDFCGFHSNRFLFLFAEFHRRCRVCA